MSNFSQFSGGSRPPKSIINAFSTNGCAVISGISTSNGLKQILSGELTATVLKTILSVSGQGSISALAWSSIASASRSTRCKVTIDGVVVFDSTTAVAAGVVGGWVVGSGAATSAATFDQIFFNASFLVEIASSLTETDQIFVGINYKTF